ncbi:MAG: AarF/UbiB family protein [Flavobacteriaceae bacterium]|nr:AarF/UbiB family protein [Flavobacteriaceae bacterium]
MKQYPSIVEYEKAIRTLGSACLNLPNGYEFIPNKLQPIKVFKVASGSFAIVFKVREIGTGKLFALRGFLNMANPKKIDRAIAISNSLQTVSEYWICKTQFFPNGISINHQQYPIILMEWCDGIPLNEYVSTILQDNYKIAELQRKLVELSLNLEALEIAHGDIHAGNILVASNGGDIVLKLVDYDPIYVPELKGELAMEIGHSSYQHPKRDKSYYDETIDRFSFWLLLTSLEALKFDKSLWKRDTEGGFNDEDNFLFKAKDLENPNHSQLVNKIKGLNQSSINYYLNELFSDEFSPNREKVSLYQEEVSIIKPTRINPEKPLIEAEPTPTTSTPLQRTDFIINSIPSGANVYSGNQYLGATPLHLPISLFSLNRNQVEYNIPLTEGNNIPPILPPTPPEPAPLPPKKSNNNAVIIIIAIAIISIILLLAFLSEKRERYNYNYEPPTEIYESPAEAVETPYESEATAEVAVEPYESPTESEVIRETAPASYEYSTESEPVEVYSSYYSDDEVIDRLNRYYNAVYNSNYYAFYDLFSSRVNRFFGKYNLSPNDIIEEAKTYDSIYPYKELTIDENSIVIHRYNNETTARYNIVYKVKKYYDDPWKYFYLTIYVEFDENLRIKNIFEAKN